MSLQVPISLTISEVQELLCPSWNFCCIVWRWEERWGERRRREEKFGLQLNLIILSSQLPSKQCSINFDGQKTKTGMQPDSSFIVFVIHMQILGKNTLKSQIYHILLIYLPFYKLNNYSVVYIKLEKSTFEKCKFSRS